MNIRQSIKSKELKISLDNSSPTFIPKPIRDFNKKYAGINDNESFIAIDDVDASNVTSEIDLKPVHVEHKKKYVLMRKGLIENG